VPAGLPDWCSVALGPFPRANTPKTPDGHLYMGFQNNNTITGLDITLKVVAFTAEQQFETRTVRKPAKITRTKGPVFGE
jgi:hypothetical protein